MNVWTPLLDVLAGFAALGAVVLAIGLILAGLAVHRLGASKVLAFFRGQGRFYGGNFYGNDVIRAAMVDVNNQRRAGVLLDSFSANELESYQGGRSVRAAEDRQYWNLRREHERSFWNSRRERERNFWRVKRESERGERDSRRDRGRGPL